MASPWYFYYQQRGKEDTWQLAPGDDRDKIVTTFRPAFCTVLDLSMVPEDKDWSKVKYRGPLYFDFDADGDLELACQQVRAFIGKLDGELGFGLDQARYYASGSKGFHVEIPPECFQAKVPAGGTAWLPYIYRAIAESLFVDTLDLNVYTGKSGRQWRTTNVQRENGCYKVPLTLDEVLAITPEDYAELIKAPRLSSEPAPPTFNAKFSLAFERARQKMTDHMRTRKKRQEKSSAILDPYIKTKSHPHTMLGLMSGKLAGDDAGFQKIAMQIAIYATSVEMPLAEMLERCKGLIENHVSDSRRYSSEGRRREELARMYEYMAENGLYDFDVGAIVRLLKPGTPVPDLGIMATDDDDDRPAVHTTDPVDDTAAKQGETVVEPKIDLHASVRRGVFMNGDGIWVRRNGDVVESVCRATFRQVEKLYDITSNTFTGFEFDIVARGRTTRVQAGREHFSSSLKIREFFSRYELSYQGSEAETAGILDIMHDKAERSGRVWTYPREGFFVINHPDKVPVMPVLCYLTQDTFISSIPKNDPNYFVLRYRPAKEISSYCIDIHTAPDLKEEHIPLIRDLLNLNEPTRLADMLGWMVAAHYRSLYLHLFDEFPMLQLYAPAGSGKTHSVKLLAHLHWYRRDRIPVTSAMAPSKYALQETASASHSAPMIVDEFKPRELKAKGDLYASLKDLFKANYNGSFVGMRGNANWSASSDAQTSMHKSKASAPIVFMGEALENESAIFERSVCVGLSPSFITKARREAHDRLMANSEATSALGKAIVQMGFLIDLKEMVTKFNWIKQRISDSIPDVGEEGVKRAAPRLIHNRTVILHGLYVLKTVLARRFGHEFDDEMDNLINARTDIFRGEEGNLMAIYGMSETAKVLNRIALLTRDVDTPNEIRRGKDYIQEPGGEWVEIRVERCYDKYKRYCVAHGDTALYDTLEQFIVALSNFDAAIDKTCADSALREDGSTENIIRFSGEKLRRLGIRSFRY